MTSEVHNNMVFHNCNCINFCDSVSEKYDFIIADPPYSSGGMVRGDRTGTPNSKYLQSGFSGQELLSFFGDNRDQRSFFKFSILWMEAALSVLNDGGVICVFTDWRQLPITTDAMQVAGFVWRGIVPWYKKGARPQPNRYKSSCEYIAWGTNGAKDFSTENATYPEGFYQYTVPQDRIHVTEKPVNLYRHLYQLVPDKGKIFDPFLGSATSAMAAYHENRDLSFTGCEIKTDVFEIALKRFNEYKSQLLLSL